MNSVLEQMYSKDPEFLEVGGRKAVKSFGNLEKEYGALREGAMIYDCSNYGLFLAAGSSAESFLEKLCTKDIQYLNVGNISECYLLNEEAQVVGSVFVYRREEDFLVIAPWEQAEAVKIWLNARAEEEELQITDLTGEKAMLSVEGPKSWQLVKKVFEIEIETLALRYAQECVFQGEKAEILRIGRSSEYGYMILASAECGKHIYDAVTEEGQSFDFPVEEGGKECLELAMLEVHQPNFIYETKEYGNILELAQQWYIQYDKEDYIGYEKLMELAKAGTVKNAVGFTGEEEDAPYASGTVITSEGEPVGKVVYSKYSIKLNRVLGIAVLDNPYGQSGLDFQAETEHGKKAVHTVSSPFVRPLSWDLKME